MPAFRLGALRDLFGKSDDSKRRKPEEAVTKLESLQEAARAARAAPPEAESVQEEALQEMKEAKAKVARAGRKPAPSPQSYTAAHTERPERREPPPRAAGQHVA